MKKISILCLLGCFLICFESFGQSQTVRSVGMLARGSGSEGAFQFHVTSIEDSIKIKYRFKKGVSNQLSNDANYRSIGRDFIQLSPNTNKDTLNLYVQKLDSIVEYYTNYDVIHVGISNHENEAYSQLVDQIFAASSESLEKNRIVLDGISMVLTLKNDKSARKIYAHSPDQVSHPLVYAFVTETMNLYRQKNGVNSKDRSFTYGY